jgi:hypothetical protein
VTFDQLSSQIREGSWGSVTTTFPTLDNLLELITAERQKDKDRKGHSFVLSDVPAVEFNIPPLISKYEADEWEDDDIAKYIGDESNLILLSKTLKPYDMNRILEQDERLHFEINKRVKSETNIGHFLRFSNVLAVLRSSMGGDAFVSNPFIGRLKYYYNKFFVVGGKEIEPFFEDNRGRINVSVDAMVATRSHLLAEAAYIYESKMKGEKAPNGVSLEEIYIQLIEYLFQDPFNNTLKLKKLLGNLKPALFAKSTSGVAARWTLEVDTNRAPLSHFVATDVSSLGNDQISYNLLNEPRCKFIDNYGTERIRPVKSCTQAELDRGELLRGALDSDVSDLNDEGLDKVAGWYVSMIDAEVNKSNMAQAALMSFIETAAGFLRMRPDLAHVGQARDKPSFPDGADEEKVHAYFDAYSENYQFPVHLMSKAFKDLSANITDEGVKDNLENFGVTEGHVLTNMRINKEMFTMMIMSGYTAYFRRILHNKTLETVTSDVFKNAMPSSYPEFLQSLVGRMTTRSAGLPSGIKMEFTIPGTDRKTVVTDNSKISNFLNDPQAFISVASLTKTMTDDEPGRIASRSVVARALRAVFMVPLAYYVTEQLMGPAFLAFQSRQEKFTLAKEVGKSFTDHAKGAAASADPTILCWGRDYSQYDSSELWRNVRRYILAAVLEGLVTSSLARKEFDKIVSVPFGPWRDGIPEMVSTMWHKLRDAVFVTGDFKLVLDQVLSGETFTITINNLVNDSNLTSLAEVMLNGEVEAPLVGKSPEWGRRLQEASVKISKVITWYMGDDSEEFDVVAGVGEQEGFINQDDLRILKDATETVTTANGMSLNSLKIVVRVFWYEYLKKTFGYGWAIPRLLQLQTMASETLNQNLSFNEQLRSYMAICSEVVSRGGDHDLLYYMFLFTSNLRRRVKVGSRFSKDESVSRFVNLPMGVVFGPGSMGMVGASPGSLVGVSKDGVLYLMYDAILKETINQAAYTLDIGFDDFSRKLVNEVYDTDVFRKGQDFINGNLNPGRRQLSRQALSNLASIKVDIGELGYEETPRRLVRGAISGNPNLKSLIVDEKNQRAVAILGRKRSLEGLRTNFNPITITIDSYDDATAKLVEFGLECECRESKVLCVSYRKYTQFLQEADKFRYDYHLLHMNEVANTSGKMLVVIGGHHTTLGSVMHLTIGPDRWEMDGKRVNYAKLVRTFRGLNRRSDVVKDYFTEKFRWLNPVMVEYTDIVPIRLDMPFAPIAGISPPIEDIIRRIGISGGGDDTIVRLSREITRLLADKFFPSDIRLETIMELIMRPKIAESSKHIRWVLEAMGASAEMALSVAANVHKLILNFIRTSAPLVYSTQDQIIGLIDTSLASVTRVVNIRSTFLENNPFHNAIRTMGFIASMIAPTRYNDGTLRPRNKIEVGIYGKKAGDLEEKSIPANEVVSVDEVGYFNYNPELIT